jgi:hypothetical protein
MLNSFMNPNFAIAGHLAEPGTFVIGLNPKEDVTGVAQMPVWKKKDVEREKKDEIPRRPKEEPQTPEQQFAEFFSAMLMPTVAGLGVREDFGEFFNRFYAPHAAEVFYIRRECRAYLTQVIHERNHPEHRDSFAAFAA